MGRDVTPTAYPAAHCRPPRGPAVFLEISFDALAFGCRYGILHAWTAPPTSKKPPAPPAASALARTPSAGCARKSWTARTWRRRTRRRMPPRTPATRPTRSTCSTGTNTRRDNLPALRGPRKGASEFI